MTSKALYLLCILSIVAVVLGGKCEWKNTCSQCSSTDGCGWCPTEMTCIPFLNNATCTFTNKAPMLTCSCEKITSCSECVALTECGWCSDRSSCMSTTDFTDCPGTFNSITCNVPNVQHVAVIVVSVVIAFFVLLTGIIVLVCVCACRGTRGLNSTKTVTYVHYHNQQPQVVAPPVYTNVPQYHTMVQPSAPTYYQQ